MDKLIYLEKKEILLGYSYLALKSHFKSEEDFNVWFNNIESDNKKNSILKITPYYLALVKNGDWHINIPNSNNIIDCFTNTYKFIAIFSFIESLSDLNHIDFYQYLNRKKYKIQFPLSKDDIDKQYKKYKNEFGAIRRCIHFFELLSEKRKNDLISKLKTDRSNTASIENFAKYLYSLRSKFVHEAKLVHQLSSNPFISVENNKTIRCLLTMEDAMDFFEEGLIAWCNEKI